MTAAEPVNGFECPLPAADGGDRILMGHGSGGKMTHSLIREVFSKYFHSSELAQGDDAAVTDIPAEARRIAVTTDSHVVKPLFYNGGDIGRLCVSGTVNDLLTSGAVPYALAAGFILEEGLPIATLERVLASMQATAEEAGVILSAADTKVVEHGKCDGIYITTTGYGWMDGRQAPSGRRAQPGDHVLISGKIAAHGMAVLCARGALGFQSEVKSDNAPLTEMVGRLRAKVPTIHVLRDPTRGGLATTLNEIAEQSRVTIALNQAAIPIDPYAGQICELLGYDPLWVANEGIMVVIVPEADSSNALDIMRTSRYGADAAIIGSVTEPHPLARVTLETPFGTHQMIDSLPGEMLPRIC